MSIEIYPIRGIPEVVPGNDLAALIVEGLEASQISLFEHDILVITHKVVSKAEGRIESAPDDRAYRNLAEREARSILRRRGDLLITQTEHGFICANAGVDRSNVANGLAVLLPIDPDRSAHRIQLRIERMTGVSIAVVVTWIRGPHFDLGNRCGSHQAGVHLHGEIIQPGASHALT